MKFVFLVFVVSSLLCIPVHAKEIFITASAEIYSDDIVEAKERVLKNAHLKAVKKGVEIFLVKKLSITIIRLSRSRSIISIKNSSAILK